MNQTGLTPILIVGDGTPKRQPPRVKGIETLDGLEVGEPGAIPGVAPRIIKAAAKQLAPVGPLDTVTVKAPKKINLRTLTQQQRMIYSSRSKRVI
jgi:hypothetical protein